MISIRSTAGLLALTLLLTQPQIGKAQVGDVGIQDIRQSPKQYMNKQVTVTGEVEEVYGPHAFLIENERPGEDAEILVISLVPYSRIVGPLSQYSNAKVTGMVRELDTAAFQRDYTGFKLDPTLAQQYNRQPVIVIGMKEFRSGMQTTPQPAATTTDVLTATVDKVLDDPKAYYGRHVTVTGDVDEILGRHAFVLEDNDLGSDEDLLVVSLTPYEEIVQNVQENQIVTVTGFLSRLTDSEFEWDRKVLNLDDDVLDHYEGRPVLVIGIQHTRTSQK